MKFLVAIIACSAVAFADYTLIHCDHTTDGGYCSGTNVYGEDGKCEAISLSSSCGNTRTVYVQASGSSSSTSIRATFYSDSLCNSQVATATLTSTCQNISLGSTDYVQMHYQSSDTHYCLDTSKDCGKYCSDQSTATSCAATSACYWSASSSTCFSSCSNATTSGECDAIHSNCHWGTVEDDPCWKALFGALGAALAGSSLVLLVVLIILGILVVGGIVACVLCCVFCRRKKEKVIVVHNNGGGGAEMRATTEAKPLEP
eukprot:TRINITY_DN46104_c0_g1_i1.p1 TRINITY_DN46104_c0_g1~~TRINITY_DN46104_c0_g1_i1.p1  ORF type:complete len:289 (+),score=32.85 TRINITY_DN46104_c0_g1_i1:92-868(+)